MRVASFISSCILLVPLMSCGRATAQAPSSRTASGATLAASVPDLAPAAARRSERRSTALLFDLNGRAFPLPLLHGTVSGEPVWMLVDTGANSHVIAKWVARKVGMKLRALGSVGSDHTGHAMSAYAVDHPNVTIDGWGALDDAPMLVTEVPRAIEGLGIGAFVSPQWLAEGKDGIVLDLGAHVMRSELWDDAVREMTDRGGASIAPEGGRLCKSRGSLVRGLSFVLPASIDGHKVDLLLDTGAQRTDLLTTSTTGELLVGRSTPSREQTYAASGLVRARLVRAAQVTLGGWTVTTDIDLVAGVADPSCPRDGVVSMDALASCTLLIGRKEMLGRCGFQK